MKKFISILVILLFAAVIVSCSVNRHIIGNGPQGNATESARQWYILWGLIPLGQVDTKQMAGDATDYAIETKQGFVDILLNMFTGIVTVSSRTVTVEK